MIELEKFGPSNVESIQPAIINVWQNHQVKVFEEQDSESLFQREKYLNMGNLVDTTFSK